MSMTTVPPSGSPRRSGRTATSSSRAAGELDDASAAVLHRQVKDIWETTPVAGLVVDLSGVTFCGSASVGVLMLLLRQGRDQRSSLVLSRIQARLERILTITGLRALFQVESSVQEAIQVLQASPRSAAPPQTTGEAEVP
ncbi:STAS domain-containing protein [Nonomuraea sp. MTCD27]|uniref:STAS domain-containing protein n=1 Tax=Nonomuraea sp. MTCD27 TaxID=1676747 RepID=UPI0035BFA414